MRSAFSLRISIFSILWQAVFSSLSMCVFLSLRRSVSLTMLSASALSSFAATSSLRRPCSALSSLTSAVSSASSPSLAFRRSSNCSCVVKSSSFTRRTPLLACSPALLSECCPSSSDCVCRKRSCSRAVSRAYWSASRCSRRDRWVLNATACCWRAASHAAKRESWLLRRRKTIEKFLERLLWTTYTMLTNYNCYYSTMASVIRILQLYSSLKIIIKLAQSPKPSITSPPTDNHPQSSVSFLPPSVLCRKQFYYYLYNMEKLKQTFERAWRGVIAPSRYQYNINTVCPREQMIDGKLIERLDFSVPRDDGSNISAVILREKHRPVKDALLYFHGNGGSKIEILGVLPLIAEHGVAVISFDFVGCGNSDNGFLTYGINESADAETVLREAYKYLEVERLTVWGRSMGAVTAIVFAAKNHKIVDKLVLDSPFRSLQEVVRRVIDRETSLPHPLVSLLLYFLKREIETRLGLPLFAEDYMAHFKRIPRTVAVLLICSENDSIVPKQEVEEFYRAFRGDRELMEIEEGHEEDRGTKVYSEVLRWVKKEKGRKNMKLRLFRPEECYECEKEQVYTIC